MTTELDIQLTATGDNPLVGVVMGSDSDWPTMEAAVGALAEFGIACEVGVVSAHRMPEDMVAYGRSASERGLRVIIAGAGGAGAKVHLYGKEVRPGRKLGHVTVVDADPALALERARAAVSALKGEAPTD